MSKLSRSKFYARWGLLFNRGRCQARRPQAKKVRLDCVLPSGLDVEHKIHEIFFDNQLVNHASITKHVDLFHPAERSMLHAKILPTTKTDSNQLSILSAKHFDVCSLMMNFFKGQKRFTLIILFFSQC